VQSAAYRGTEAANTAVSVTVRGKIGQRVVLDALAWSYSAAPAGGRISAVGVTSSRGVSLDVTVAGADSLPLGRYGIPFDAGEDVLITLAPGGAAVVGSVSVVARWVDDARWQTATS